MFFSIYIFLAFWERGKNTELARASITTIRL